MTDALRLARAVRELLATPDRWTQYTYAVNAAGLMIGYQSDAACRWCLGGAIHKLAGTQYPGVTPAGNELRRRLSKAAGLDDGVAIERWNDTPGRTHAEVLALLDRVIAEMEAEQ